MKTLMRLSANYSESIHPTKEWRENQLKSMQCSGCSQISREWYPRPINVVLKNVPNDMRITSGICFSPLDIYHIGLIKQLSSHLDNFIIGKCFYQEGCLLQEYVTCYTNYRIVVRGRKFSRYEECSVCGTISSTPLSPKYILKSYLTDARVYQDSSCSMYIDEELAMELDFSPWPNAELEPIEVRDIPIDERRLSCDPPDPPWYYLY